MRVLYLDEEKMLIEITPNLYYYGNGKDINDFSKNMLQWLRFNPYMRDVSNDNIAIPNTIKKIINEYTKES